MMCFHGRHYCRFFHGNLPNFHKYVWNRLENDLNTTEYQFVTKIQNLIQNKRGKNLALLQENVKKRAWSEKGFRLWACVTMVKHKKNHNIRYSSSGYILKKRKMQLMLNFPKMQKHYGSTPQLGFFHSIVFVCGPCELFC